jgi:hypothetical protein
MRRIFLIVWCAVAAMRCAGGNPVAPSPPSTPFIPMPTPVFTFSEPFTELLPSQTITRHVAADGPECVDLPGWNCHFFRISMPSDGTLDIHLAWALEAQEGQSLDLSLEESNGRAHWSNYGPGPQGNLRMQVSAGRTYQLTVWYMFIGAEYEIQSSFQLD